MHQHTHKAKERRFIYVNYVTNRGRLTELQSWSFTIHWLIIFACRGPVFLLFLFRLLSYFSMDYETELVEQKSKRKTQQWAFVGEGWVGGGGLVRPVYSLVWPNEKMRQAMPNNTANGQRTQIHILRTIRIPPTGRAGRIMEGHLHCEAIMPLR